MVPGPAADADPAKGILPRLEHHAKGNWQAGFFEESGIHHYRLPRLRHVNGVFPGGVLPGTARLMLQVSMTIHSHVRRAVMAWQDRALLRRAVL